MFFKSKVKNRSVAKAPSSAVALLRRRAMERRRQNLRVLLPALRDSLIFIFVLIFFIFNFSFSIFNLSFAAVPQELKQAIDQKNQELKEINDKIQESQKTLESTQEQKQTLQREVNNINSNISQLNLSIRLSETNIEKLKLEIDSLQYDVADIEEQINIKKEATAETLRQLQQKDNENILTILLKNNSLSDSVFEAQSLADLGTKLAVDINALKDLRVVLNGKLDEKSNKKINIEFENQNLKNRKTIVEEQKNERQKILTQTKNQEKIYQQQISDLEKKREEISAEINEIERELRAKIDPSLLPTARPGVLATPAIGTLSQSYGATEFAKRNYSGGWHNGIDIAAPIGTPIFAAEEGKVIVVGNQDLYCYRGAYGKFVVIEHNNNLTTLYAHLSLIAIKEMAEVKRGDLIGYMGKTGWATGPHLHFTVYASQTFEMKPSRLCGMMPFGGDLNPLNYLSI